MLNSRLVIIFFVLIAAFGVVAIAAPDFVSAFLIIIIFSSIGLFLLRRYSDDPAFITKIFFLALAARLLFGMVVYLYDLQGFFGGDAITYDDRGATLLGYWMGDVPPDSSTLMRATNVSGPGWGMTYLVGSIYLIVGRSLLAAQSFAAIVGAATAPLVYICSNLIYKNSRVARFAAICVAIFPAFIIWSGQLLKDGLIVFLLVLVMLMVLKLQEKFSYPAIVVLVLSLGGIISLRFYIFYMVAAAVAGSFILGTSATSASLLRRLAVLIVAGMLLTYLGVLRTASSDIETYADLERIQRSRLDLAKSAESGFGEDIDVSTPEGALTAIPIGLVYLMLAPFPWQATTLRQSITLPEVFVWWAMLPLLVWGMWYTIKHKLRAAFPILMFSLMLTLAYSIFQGNVGTAYRQRTQVQVFFFMFIAVGWVLLQERRENRKLIKRHRLPQPIVSR